MIFIHVCNESHHMWHIVLFCTSSLPSGAVTVSLLNRMSERYLDLVLLCFMAQAVCPK